MVKIKNAANISKPVNSPAKMILVGLSIRPITPIGNESNTALKAFLLTRNQCWIHISNSDHLNFGK